METIGRTEQPLNIWCHRSVKTIDCLAVVKNAIARAGFVADPFNTTVWFAQGKSRFVLKVGEINTRGDVSISLESGHTVLYQTLALLHSPDGAALSQIARSISQWLSSWLKTL